jgi:hypothetical protein
MERAQEPVHKRTTWGKDYRLSGGADSFVDAPGRFSGAPTYSLQLW